MTTKQRLSPVQRQILLFLGTGGPAYIGTGSRGTRCGEVTGGDRWVSTSMPVLYFLEHHKLIVQDAPGKNALYRANRAHPLVQKLLGGHLE